MVSLLKKLNFYLDSFFFDDLQNVIHERLARPGLRTVTDFLETWVRFLSLRFPDQIQTFEWLDFKSYKNVKQ